jgi:hypothetical protein
MAEDLIIDDWHYHPTFGIVLMGNMVVREESAWSYT